MVLPVIKPGDTMKEFQLKAIQIHGTFHGLKITNWFSQKPCFSGAPSPQKWSNGLSSAICCRFWQCQPACEVLANVHVLFRS